MSSNKVVAEGDNLPNLQDMRTASYSTPALGEVRTVLHGVKLDECPAALRARLARFDVNGNGLIDPDELPIADSSDAISIKAFPNSIRDSLGVFDKDGDGSVNMNELMHAADLYRESKQQTKRLVRLVIGLVTALFLVIGAIVGLTAAVVELSKETSVKDDGVLRSKAKNVPIKVASQLSQGDLTSELPDETLFELKYLKITSATGNSASLFVLGISRMPEKNSCHGTVVNIITHVGTVTLDGKDLVFSKDADVDVFHKSGFMVSTNGRRLMGAYTLLGFFNFIEKIPLLNAPCKGSKPGLPNGNFSMTITVFESCADEAGTAVGKIDRCHNEDGYARKGVVKRDDGELYIKHQQTLIRQGSKIVTMYKYDYEDTYCRYELIDNAKPARRLLDEELGPPGARRQMKQVGDITGKDGHQWVAQCPSMSQKDHLHRMQDAAYKNQGATKRRRNLEGHPEESEIGLGENLEALEAKRLDRKVVATGTMNAFRCKNFTVPATMFDKLDETKTNDVKFEFVSYQEDPSRARLLRRFRLTVASEVMKDVKGGSMETEIRDSVIEYLDEDVTYRPVYFEATTYWGMKLAMEVEFDSDVGNILNLDVPSNFDPATTSQTCPSPDDIPPLTGPSVPQPKNPRDYWNVDEDKDAKFVDDMTREELEKRFFGNGTNATRGVSVENLTEEEILAFLANATRRAWGHSHAYDHPADDSEDLIHMSGPVQSDRMLHQKCRDYANRVGNLYTNVAAKHILREYNGWEFTWAHQQCFIGNKNGEGGPGGGCPITDSRDPHIGDLESEGGGAFDSCQPKVLTAVLPVPISWTKVSSIEFFSNGIRSLPSVAVSSVEKTPLEAINLPFLEVTAGGELNTCTNVFEICIVLSVNIATMAAQILSGGMNSFLTKITNIMPALDFLKGCLGYDFGKQETYLAITVTIPNYWVIKAEWSSSMRWSDCCTYITPLSLDIKGGINLGFFEIYGSIWAHTFWNDNKYLKGGENQRKNKENVLPVVNDRNHARYMKGTDNGLGGVGLITFSPIITSPWKTCRFGNKEGAPMVAARVRVVDDVIRNRRRMMREVGIHEFTKDDGAQIHLHPITGEPVPMPVHNETAAAARRQLLGGEGFDDVEITTIEFVCGDCTLLKTDDPTQAPASVGEYTLAKCPDGQVIVGVYQKGARKRSGCRRRNLQSDGGNCHDDQGLYLFRIICASVDGPHFDVNYKRSQWFVRPAPQWPGPEYSEHPTQSECRDRFPQNRCLGHYSAGMWNQGNDPEAWQICKQGEFMCGYQTSTSPWRGSGSSDDDWGVSLITPRCCKAFMGVGTYASRTYKKNWIFDPKYKWRTQNQADLAFKCGRPGNSRCGKDA